MNLNRSNLLFAICAFFMISHFSACNKYSSDTPFPEVYSPTLFTGSNNNIVYAIDPKTGDTKWKRTVTGEIQATPVLFNKFLWVGTTEGYLYRLNFKDGTIKDSVLMNGSIIGTPLPYNNYLLVPAGGSLHAVDSHLVSIWTYNMGSPILSSPTKHAIPGISDNAIFISGQGNKVAALFENGSEIWSYTPTTAGEFNSSPCVVNDSFLYIGNNNGNVYALFTHNGTQKWRFATQGAVRSSPIQIGGNVLVGSSDRNFYSIDSASGSLRWKVETQDVITSSPSVFNQNIYFGSFDKNIYCIDIIDGTVKWKQKTFGLIKSSPVIYDGYVFIGSFDKNLYKLNALDGSQQWVKNINGQMECSAIIDSISGVALPSISGDYKY